MVLCMANASLLIARVRRLRSRRDLRNVAFKCVLDSKEVRLDTDRRAIAKP